MLYSSKKTLLNDLKYDVFLSYNSSDKRNVFALARRLKNDGIKVWYDDWEIKAGDDIYLKIEQGLAMSRTLVLIVSSHTFGSDWPVMEYTTSLFRDPCNKQRRFIPLLIENCTIPDTIRRFKYIDWRNQDAKQYKNLLRTIRF
jgi:hypothetical protein